VNKNGPVIVIEDDADNKLILEGIFQNLGYNNTVVFFTDGEAALAYLNQPDIHPFLILSDIHVPKISGFELRKSIHTNKQLHLKCIPYLFFSTNANKKAVTDAYAMAVQGFFARPGSSPELENTIRKIMEYWKECIAPNEF
jgi:CheY-like chemotaxis protein